MLRYNFAIGTAMILLGSSSLGQEAATAKACAGDIKTLCADVQPGEGRVKACVKSHFKELSETCQAEVLKAAAIDKACADDVKKMCAGIEPSGGRIEACLKPHLTEVSEPCKETISAAFLGILHIQSNE
jgi:hypothetical protein